MKTVGTDATSFSALPDLPVVPVPPEKWRNGIAVRMPNWLGDAVMALPALRQLSLLKPKECALLVIAPKALHGLFEATNFVDVFLGLERVHHAWKLREIRALRRFRMGVGVLFNNSLRDALMMKAAGVPLLFGAGARGRSLLLERAFSLERARRGKYAMLHQTARFLAMTRALGAPEWDGSLPELTPRTPAAECSGVVQSLCRHPRLLALGCGAAYGGAKRWESEKFNAVARAFLVRGGVVAAVGSAKESEVCREVLAGLPENRAFDLSGKTSLDELMNLLKNACFVVANDSGVMHLASILGTPGAAVFGSTDYTATGPIGKNWTLFCSEMECSPCFRRTCPRGDRACMKEIPAEKIIGMLP